MPEIRILSALALEVWAGALRAPLIGKVVDGLGELAAFAVAKNIADERAYHLAVTVVAALAHIDVPPGEFERCVDALHRAIRGHGFL